MTSAAGGPVLRARERVRIVTPLGIRFWDAALNLPVQGGLRVRGWLAAAPHMPVEAIRTTSGIYAFHGLPGLHEMEYPPGDAEAAAATRRDYVIDVVDDTDRFIPARLVVRLPLDAAARGLFLSDAQGVGDGGPGSMPGNEPRLYLFSSPARAVPPHLAAIRAQLGDEERRMDGRVPGAPYAVLRATIGGRTRTTIADHRGRALLLFSYPGVEQSPVGSPPSAWAARSSAPTWEVRLRVRYGRLIEPADPAIADPFPSAPPPTLPQILGEQPDALMREREGVGAVTELVWPTPLLYGEQLVLRTMRAGAGDPAPTLWITPGVSLP